MSFNIYKPIRLIELFAGIGSQAKAMTNLGLNFEHYRVCEFDEHAVRSYNAVHGTNFVTSDITKISAADIGIVDTDTYNYLLTYSFPCQDLSNIGKKAGMEKGSGTRSGLLWEVERLLNECTELPQVLLMENVPMVHGKNNIEHFEKWIAFLESKGYSNHYRDLNAKDYGVPQNRNRCYMVSILGDYSYEFPKTKQLEVNMRQLLDDVVDEQYYLSDRELATIQNNSRHISRYISDTKAFVDRTLNRDFFVCDYRYDEGIRIRDNECCPTLTTKSPSSLSSFPIVGYTLNGNIIYRKPTPKECWRLMGFEDEDYMLAEKVCTNSHLYKQAGNSIVVNVLMAIFKELFVPKKTRSEWLDELLGGL